MGQPHAHKFSSEVWCGKAVLVAAVMWRIRKNNTVL
jgi:hypothetical protein